MSTQQTYKERILAVLVHIQQHLDEDLSLNELARVAHFSPFHFHRIFRGLTGESVQEHVRRLRLERAAQHLKTGDEPIINVALEAGYEAHEAFTRAFGAMFDCPPSEYRRQKQARPVAAVPSGVHYRAGGDVQDFNPIPNGGQTMDVRSERMPAMRVVFVRGVGPYKEVARAAWERVCAWAGPRGLLGPNSLFLGICHDDPEVTPPDKIRYDAAIVVDRPVQPEGDVGVQEIPPGTHAVTTHRGPYETLHESWSRLCGQWLPRSGHTLRNAPSFEIYRNDPKRTPPAQLMTDLYVPIEVRGQG
jgi:AraC family transcriptional regulator